MGAKGRCESEAMKCWCGEFDMQTQVFHVRTQVYVCRHLSKRRVLLHQPARLESLRVAALTIHAFHRFGSVRR